MKSFIFLQPYNPWKNREKLRLENHPPLSILFRGGANFVSAPGVIRPLIRDCLQTTVQKHMDIFVKNDRGT